MDFHEFFLAATGNPPYPYQRRWAENQPEEAEIPTGLGKTEGAVLSWWFARVSGQPNTPRRLVYCLPQRALVAQTAARISAIGDKLAAKGIHSSGKPMPKPQIVMGGFVDDDWMQNPEHEAIIIGTQDMLLSRALNRGYGMSRYQWPMAFGGLNNDSLWIIDEVQLQGVGARTAAQLQAFRDSFGTLAPSSTIFMSATLDSKLIETPDRKRAKQILTLSDDDRIAENISKRLHAKKTLHSVQAADVSELADIVVREHRPGSLTLTIVNTVARAQELYSSLEKQVPNESLVVIHSRFRSNDRDEHASRLTNYQGGDLIAICTQVVEAGLDINAQTMITDLSPWSSMVQRFGRCNRTGTLNDSRVFWIDPGDDIERKRALPYDVEDLKSARAILQTCEGQNVGPSGLPNGAIGDGKIVPTLRRVDFIDLFDTTTDMLGNDTDIGQFIRDAGDDFQVMVFWRETPPGKNDPPRREELCAAPIPAMKKMMEKLKTSDDIQKVLSIDRFSDDDNAWKPMRSGNLRAGDVLWLHCSMGGYDPTLGFTGDEKNAKIVPEIVQRDIVTLPTECNGIEGDPLSEAPKITISQHGQETREAAKNLCAALISSEQFSEAVKTAALWHDVGKAHKVFQATMYGHQPVDSNELLAKSLAGGGRHSVPYFRHEVASALVFLHVFGDDQARDLTAYLICSHHGKARVAVQSVPGEAGPNGERSIMGIRDGDSIPSVLLAPEVQSPAISLDLDAFAMGSSNGARVWIDRTTTLRDSAEIGPFRLAYLELLVRLSDWRASALHRK